MVNNTIAVLPAYLPTFLPRTGPLRRRLPTIYLSYLPTFPPSYLVQVLYGGAFSVSDTASLTLTNTVVAHTSASATDQGVFGIFGGVIFG